MSYTFSNDIDGNQVNTQLERKYVNSHCGTEDIEVVDEALTTIEACDERAEAIFLEQSYKQSIVTLTTYYREGLNIGDVVALDGVNYVIISIDISLEGARAENEIKMKRWD